jgi:hypothetical protein
MMHQTRLNHRSTQNLDTLSTSEEEDGAETKKAGIAKVEADVEDEVMDGTKKASGKKRAIYMSWLVIMDRGQLIDLNVSIKTLDRSQKVAPLDRVEFSGEPLMKCGQKKQSQPEDTKSNKELPKRGRKPKIPNERVTKSAAE